MAVGEDTRTQTIDNIVDYLFEVLEDVDLRLVRLEDPVELHLQ